MRREIMALLHAQGTPDSDFTTAELIYAELIGNVIRHAHGTVRVEVEWTGEFATLAVIDEEPHRTPPVRLPADPLAESGRGLFIVKTLARDFTLEDGGEHGGRIAATLPVRRHQSAE